MQGMLSCLRNSKAKQALPSPMDVGQSSIFAPPNTLALSLSRRPPNLMMPLIRHSISATPAMSYPVPEPTCSPASSRWFMPPAPAMSSHRQTDTQDPSSVWITVTSSAAAANWP